MTLIGQDVLMASGRKNAPLRKWLTVWAATTSAAQWYSLEDVRKAYPAADGVKLASELVITVFNIKGNEYRLLAWIDYEEQVVESLAVLTHAQYSKEHWKARY